MPGSTVNTITYTTSYGCYSTKSITINAMPNAGNISGLSSVAVGSSITLTESVGSGVWTSSNTAKATIISTGKVTGVANGTAVITYAVTVSSCTSDAFYSIVVGTGGPRLSGADAQSLCVGYTLQLGDGTPTGVWSSNNESVARVDAQTGLVTGISAGKAAITNTIDDGTGVVVVTTNVVVSALPESISITATPGVVIQAGESITFKAEVAGGGVNPVYKWMVNGVAVPGADKATFTSATLSDNDVVTCVAGSSNGCGNYTVSNSAVVTVIGSNSASLTGNMNIHLVPNPNKGLFTLQGTLGVITDENVTLEVMDMLGQVVYSSKVSAKAGNLNQEVQLSNAIANGMYIMNVHTDKENYQFHFVIEQ